MTILQRIWCQILIFIYRDGASLCGMFMAVHNAIQQLEMDDGVDVFTTVRQLQIRRPELVGNIVSLYKGYSRSNAKIFFLVYDCFFSLLSVYLWVFSYFFFIRRISLISDKYTQIRSERIFYSHWKMCHLNVILSFSFLFFNSL